MRRFFSALVAGLGTFTLVGTIVVGAGLLFAGIWLPQSDVPSVADAIVVLGGDFRRPMYAADLYQQGYARSVYVGRVITSESAKVAAEYGFTYPEQEVVYHRILAKRGVPLEDIRMYGNDLRSTLEEAETLAEKLGDGPGRLIVVTSPYHLRRARMIFKKALPGWTVMVCGTPYETFPEHWWTSQDAAINVVLESAKIVFYLLGGGFRATGGISG